MASTRKQPGREVLTTDPASGKEVHAAWQLFENFLEQGPTPTEEDVEFVGRTAQEAYERNSASRPQGLRTQTPATQRQAPVGSPTAYEPRTGKPVLPERSSDVPFPLLARPRRTDENVFDLVHESKLPESWTEDFTPRGVYESMRKWFMSDPAYYLIPYGFTTIKPYDEDETMDIITSSDGTARSSAGAVDEAVNEGEKDAAPGAEQPNIRRRRSAAMIGEEAG